MHKLWQEPSQRFLPQQNTRNYHQIHWSPSTYTAIKFVILQPELWGVAMVSTEITSNIFRDKPWSYHVQPKLCLVCNVLIIRCCTLHHLFTTAKADPTFCLKIMHSNETALSEVNMKKQENNKHCKEHSMEGYYVYIMQSGKLVCLAGLCMWFNFMYIISKGELI